MTDIRSAEKAFVDKLGAELRGEQDGARPHFTIHMGADGKSPKLHMCGVSDVLFTRDECIALRDLLSKLFPPEVVA